MSKYTMTIRQVIQSGFDIGLKTYPIYKEEYRIPLNTKIVNHYWLREIGAETPALFAFYLNQKMNEIMPKYNLLYQALEKDIDFFDTYLDNTETNSSGNGTAKTMSNDTPMGKLSDPYSEEYATTTTQDHTESESQGKSTRHGYSGKPYAEMLYELSNKLVNIDMMIINELDDCFMQLW